jgi:hypothetical protein
LIRRCIEMMYTINYTPCLLGKATPVKAIGATVVPSERTVINFAVLEDAFLAACAVEEAGYHDVYVSDTDDPDGRYMFHRSMFNLT